MAKNGAAASATSGPMNVADKYEKLDKSTLALITKDTAMAKGIMKAAKDRTLFNHYKDTGAGMQDGGRGSTMDFLELFLILQHIKLVPKYLTKDQTYMIFTEFLEAKAVATTRGKIREESQMAKHTQSNDGGFTPPIPATIAASTTAAGDRGVDGRPKTNQSRSSKASKGKKSSEELDYDGYYQFCEHMVEILGFAPLLAREAALLQLEIERTRLRCAVFYDFAYRSTAVPRTLAQIDKRASASAATVFDSQSPTHVKQLNIAAPLVHAYNILTPRAGHDSYMGLDRRVQNNRWEAVSSLFRPLTPGIVKVVHSIREGRAGAISAPPDLGDVTTTHTSVDPPETPTAKSAKKGKGSKTKNQGPSDEEIGAAKELLRSSLMRCDRSETMHRCAQRVAQKVLKNILFSFFERWRFQTAHITQPDELFVTTDRARRLLRPELTVPAICLPTRKSFTRPSYTVQIDVPAQWLPYLPRPSLPTPIRMFPYSETLNNMRRPSPKTHLYDDL